MNAAVPIRNLDYIRAKDPKLFEAISDLDRHASTLEQQVNGNRTGQPLPPPAIDGLQVTGQNGHFHLQITHKADIYRGIQYYAEYADNPGFANPQAIHLGDSRSHTAFLGNGTYYWRAYAAYASSPPGPAAYHGGGSNPQPVSGGGAVGGPAFLAPQGTGTGLPGEGLTGPGIRPFRSSDGSLPIRGKTRGGAASGGASTQNALPAGPSTGLPEGASSTFPSGGGGGVVGAVAIYDTYANWTTASYDPAQFPVNTQIFITDRNFIEYVVRVVTGANKWVYQAGTYSVTQSAISGLKGFNGGALGANDSGLLIEVTDYAHILKWGGAAWGWGPGESGSGYFQDFAVAPTGSGWHLCDGSPGIAYLKSDGTTGTVTLPNPNGSASYRKNAGSYSATITAAVAPTISGHTETGNAAFNPANTGNDNDAGHGAATGADFTAALNPHQHSYTPTDTGHQHNLTSGNAPISLAGGDPVAHYQAITYFRQ